MIRFTSSVLFCLLISATFLGSSASGHTDRLQSSPAQAQSFGGDIDFIDIHFTERVTGATVQLVDPRGEMVEGSTTLPDGLVVKFDTKEKLTVPGRYTVKYEMISADLDETSDEYFFTFDPEAPQPFRIGSDGRFIDPAKRNWISTISTVMLIVGVVGVSGMLLYRQKFGIGKKVALEADSGN